MRGNEFWTKIGPENEEIGVIGHSLRERQSQKGYFKSKLLGNFLQ